MVASLDSGTGTVELIARIALKGEPSHAMSSHFIVAEAQGIVEGHADLARCFGSLKSQFHELRQHGITLTEAVTKKTVKFDTQFVLVADYKVLYSLCGSYGETRSHPYLWCMRPFATMGIPAPATAAILAPSHKTLG